MKRGASSLDCTDFAILEALQEDARLSTRNLSSLIGISDRAIARRIRRMEQGGVIQGYRVRINPQGLGRYITAYITVRGNRLSHAPLLEWLADRNGIMESYCFDECRSHLLKVAVRDIVRLNQVADELSQLGYTCETCIVTGSLIGWKPVTAAG